MLLLQPEFVNRGPQRGSEASERAKLSGPPNRGVFYFVAFSFHILFLLFVRLSFFTPFLGCFLLLSPSFFVLFQNHRWGGGGGISPCPRTVTPHLVPFERR